MPKQYIVVSGYYDNETLRNEFIQAIGAYTNHEQAYGAALLHLNSLCDTDETATISPLYQLEGDTGFGMSVNRGDFTDYAYVLICGENGGDDDA